MFNISHYCVHSSLSFFAEICYVSIKKQVLTLKQNTMKKPYILKQITISQLFNELQSELGGLN